MTDLPPLLRDQRKADAEHLKLLAIFHFIFAGLALAGIGFLFLHYALMSTVMNNPEMWKNQKGGPPPAEFFALFKWFYVIFGIVLVTGGIANLLSGFFMRRRIHRVFSLVVSAFNCFQFPFGTALGVFTFVVLLRDSVRETYETTYVSPFTIPPA